MRILFILATIIIGNSAYSQSFSWAHSYGAHTGDYNRLTEVDGEGNIYVVGYSSGGFSIEQIYIKESATHILKYNKNGELLWARFFNGDRKPGINSMGIDAQGKLYLGGSFTHSFLYDGIEYKHVKRDYFLMCIDDEGSAVWFEPLDSQVNQIKTFANHIYLCGTLSYGWTRFNGGVLTSESTEYRSAAYIAVLNNSGEFVRGTTIEGSNSFDKLKMAIDNRGNQYIGGYTENKALKVNGYVNELAKRYNTFLMSFDADGIQRWFWHFGSDDGYARPSDLVLDLDGNVYLTGSILGAMDFLSNQRHDYGTYLLKVNGEGKFLWKKSMTTVNTIGHTIVGYEGSRLVVDKNNAVVLVASYMRNFSVTDYPGLIHNIYRKSYSSDIAIINFHPLGFYQWSHTFGGDYAEWIGDVAYSDGDLIVAGKYQSSNIDFNGSVITNNSGNNNSDMYIASFNYDKELFCPSFKPTFQTDDLSFCFGTSAELKLAYSYGASYNWFLNGQELNVGDSILEVIEEGEYQLFINQNSICPQQTDAIRVEERPEINIDIQTKDSTIICNGSDLNVWTPLLQGMNYQWYINGEILEEAVDTGIVVNQQGSYAVQVSDNQCSSADSIEITSMLMPDISLPYDTLNLSTSGSLRVHNQNNTPIEWFHNFDKQAFARGEYIRVFAPGFYQTISENYCGIDVGETIIVKEDVGIDDAYMLQRKFKLYPNPSNGLVNIQFKALADYECKLEIITQSGTVVYQENLQALGDKYSTSVKIQGLGGVYFIRIHLADQTIVHKVVKR